MIQFPHTTEPYDTAIIGAGILGLWAARHAIKRGERVVVIEKRSVGSGASGGFLGALMPHMPDNWNPKKQFQYDGLTSLSDVIAELEADTGLSCDYRQCGRIIPLTHDKLLPQVGKRLEGAIENWGSSHSMSVEQAGFSSWLNPEMASHGLQYDTLAARVNPRKYVKALASFVRPRADVIEGRGVLAIEMQSDGGGLTLETGEIVSASRIIVANGWEAYPLVQPYLGELNSRKPVGRGVKGQAVLVDYEHNDDLPIVYHDGSYIVPHAHNRVAIGSTSINDWAGEPSAFDDQDMGFYERAMQLAPALRDAPIVERWAGVRPRNTIDGRGTSPWFGPVPGHENLIALIGGFKITLGVAHIAVGYGHS